MKKKVILVVYGGTSSEREISLRSGRACIKALKKLKHSILKFDPATKDLRKIKNYKVDLIFNALHGRDGEDGIAQSYFEYYKIPYTHSGILSSMNSMDKIISKKKFIENKIRTANYITLNLINYNLLNKIEEDYLFKYHLNIYAKYSKLLNGKERKWLASLI